MPCACKVTVQVLCNLLQHQNTAVVAHFSCRQDKTDLLRNALLPEKTKPTCYCAGKTKGLLHCDVIVECGVRCLSMRRLIQKSQAYEACRDGGRGGAAESQHVAPPVYATRDVTLVNLKQLVNNTISRFAADGENLIYARVEHC